MKRTPLIRRSRLSPVSKKRSAAMREYAKKRKAFLALHPYCEVTLALSIFRFAWSLRTATEVHHKAGRTGNNYLDESTWMAVSREGHRWIHDNPSEARRLGWLI
jgi:hypothetical protein